MSFEKNISILIIIFSFISILVGIKIFFKLEDGNNLNSKFIISYNKPGIAILKIYGPIMIQSSSSMYPSGSDHIIAKLKSFEKNDNIKAVILRINSPGGTIGAAQEICAELKKLKSKNKKIIVSMGDITASGGYYISSQADHIVANPGTLTGSIGVIMDMFEVSSLLKKIGFSSNTIKSGKFKDIGSWSRKMRTDEKALLQNVIDEAYEQFVKAVAKGRHLTVEQVKKYADGRIFTGNQAKEYGFVDELGGLQTAISAAAKLTGLTEPIHIIKSRSKFEELFQMLNVKFSNLFRIRTVPIKMMYNGN